MLGETTLPLDVASESVNDDLPLLAPFFVRLRRIGIEHLMNQDTFEPETTLGARMLEHVDIEDLYKIEGSLHKHLQIEGALSSLGGPGWDGFGFKNRVLKELGYDVDAQGNTDAMKIRAYNTAADAINKLGAKITAKKLLSELGIS